MTQLLTFNLRSTTLRPFVLYGRAARQRTATTANKAVELINYSFILAICIAPLQVLYYSEALRQQNGYCIRVSRRSAQATVSKGLAQGSLRGG